MSERTIHAASLVVLALCGIEAIPAQQHGGAASAERKVPALLDDLGSYHRGITTSSESVQRYFDQGLRLLYAFNLEEAQRSFAEAVARDPECAACFWGLGMSLSPHYNLPGLAERTAAGARAVAGGLAVAADKPAIERDLLAALARRLSDPAPESVEGFVALDLAYAEAMEELARRYFDDLEVQAYYAEALMNLRPWKLWTPAGEPEPGTLEIVAQLERVLERNPDHPGANHMLIHALEASPQPERALRAAERLATAMPGAAHMVHMPAHIWARLGRWADAAQANRDAIAVDRRYVPTNPGVLGGFYAMYYAHNYQFLWWSALQGGRYAEALENGRTASGGMPLEMLRAFPGYDFFLEYPIWTQVRFGRWTEALAETAPPEEFLYATAVWRAARGIAFARTGRLAECRAELVEVEKAYAALPEGALQGLNPATIPLGIARDWLAGELALAGGDVEAGLAKLRAAFDAEGTLGYDEPPDWYISTGPALGEALLVAGRDEEAAEVFAIDLTRYRENGWSLAGLVASLESSGRPSTSERERLRTAWGAADSPLPFVEK